MASVRSLDNALEVSQNVKITDDFGVTQIPDNGRILRNLIHGADTVMSHITHFYHLAALDFVDVQGLGAPFSPTYTTSGVAACPALLPGSHTMGNGNPVVSNYVEALTMRRKMHTASAIFSGRHPIQNAIVPGGATSMPTASDVIAFTTLLDTVRNFINTAYVPDVVSVANYASVYWTVGTGTGNLLSYGEYPIQRGTAPEALLIDRGLTAGAVLSVNGNQQPTAFLGNVREFVDYSYYKSPTGLAPAVGKTEPDVTLVGGTGQQYTWLKAPRFGTSNLVCEVGPLPRMVVTFANGGGQTVSEATSKNIGSVPVTPLVGGGTYTVNGLITTALTLVGQTGNTAGLLSTLGRHAARALECKLVADAMADTGDAVAAQAWLTELRAGAVVENTGTTFSNLTNPTYVYAKLPVKPRSGAGWAEAPRGALGHWISIEKKRITNYQCVVPSTWNHSPRDAGGNWGAAEAVVMQAAPLVPALGGADDLLVSVLRLLHQWDFCIACAVHVVKPDGSTALKFKMETDGRVTKLPHDAEI